VKLGLIADVHADLERLLLALDLLDGRGAEQILCAGDLVSKGRQGDAVVALLRHREIPCVMGNHDEDAPLYQEMYGMVSNSPMVLAPKTLAYLADLPLTRQYSFAGKALMLAHGTVWNNTEYVYARPDSQSLQLTVQSARLARVDVVVLGHTHEPMAVDAGDVRVYNPGSVCGQRVGGSATCAMLTLPECIFEVFSIDTGEAVKPEFARL
jgi:putative phosphoesterase